MSKWRVPGSFPTMASRAFKIRFMRTCWSSTRLPAYQGQGRGRLLLPGDLAKDQLAAEEREGLVNELVQIQWRSLLVCAAVKRAQALDDLAGPFVVLDDVLERLADLIEVRWIERQELLRSFGVAQDRGQGLPQLVGQ